VIFWRGRRCSGVSFEKQSLGGLKIFEMKTVVRVYIGHLSLYVFFLLIMFHLMKYLPIVENVLYIPLDLLWPLLKINLVYAVSTLNVVTIVPGKFIRISVGCIFKSKKLHYKETDKTDRHVIHLYDEHDDNTHTIRLLQGFEGDELELVDLVKNKSLLFDSSRSEEIFSICLRKS